MSSLNTKIADEVLKLPMQGQPDSAEADEGATLWGVLRHICEQLKEIKEAVESE